MGIPPTYEPCCGFCIHLARAVGLVSIGTMGKWSKNAYLKPSCILPLQDCNEALGTDHGHWSDPLRRKVSPPFLQHGKTRGACTLGSDLVGSKASDEDGVAAVNTQNHRGLFKQGAFSTAPSETSWFSEQCLADGRIEHLLNTSPGWLCKRQGCAVQGHSPRWVWLLHFCAFVPPTSQKGHCICPSSFPSLLHWLKGKGSVVLSLGLGSHKQVFASLGFMPKGKLPVVTAQYGEHTSMCMI